MIFFALPSGVNMGGWSPTKWRQKWGESLQNHTIASGCRGMFINFQGLSCYTLVNIQKIMENHQENLGKLTLSTGLCSCSMSQVVCESQAARGPTECLFFLGKSSNHGTSWWCNRWFTVGFTDYISRYMDIYIYISVCVWYHEQKATMNIDKPHILCHEFPTSWPPFPSQRRP